MEIDPTTHIQNHTEAQVKRTPSSLVVRRLTLKKHPHGVIAEIKSSISLCLLVERCTRCTFEHFEIFDKIQDGGEAPDMVILTFFLWEITSKFFFLPWGLWLLAMQQN